MIFAKVDVVLLTHPKAIGAGLEAMGLWSWGLLYARQHELDGVVPKAAARGAWGAHSRLVDKLAKRLCESGLWTESADGLSWVVSGYALKNETRESIQERRKVDSARKQWARNKPVDENVRSDSVIFLTKPTRGIPDSDSDSDSVVKFPERNKLPVTAREPEGDAPRGVMASHVRYRDAYAEGVELGLGSPYIPAWAAWEYGVLAQAVQRFAVSPETRKPFEGDRLLEWIRRAAKDFVRDMRGRGKEEFAGAWAPKTFAKWLVQDEARHRQAAEARAVP